MTTIPDSFHNVPTLGVVIIGRNEGERLQHAIKSVLHEQIVVTYVDSGSFDGSAELAKSLGVEVHCLDTSKPFSPSRGRVEGITQLLKKAPHLQFIQFLDGDCEIMQDWLFRAENFLKENKNTAIICGKVTEAAPEQSIYNRLSPLRWEMPVGQIQACGGIFMIRREVYEAVGGFNSTLMTREESDLCERVRDRGHKIIRLDTLMAKHDSALLHFNQWWIRAVWGGYGDALAINAAPTHPSHIRRLIWYLTWPFAFPILALYGLLGMIWSPYYATLPLFYFMSQCYLFSSISYARFREGDTWSDSALFAAFTLVRNFACGLGFLKFFLQKDTLSKRPDPHAH